MRLLLDTHILVWLVDKPNLLKPAEFALLRNPENELWASAVSFWEIRLKWESYFRSGTRKGPGDPAHFLAAAKLMGISELPLSAGDAAAALAHPVTNNDPFDVLLLTQAQQANLRLLTRDRKLRDHPVAIIPA